MRLITRIKNLNKSYTEMKKEVFKIVSKIKPKTISDCQVIAKFKEPGYSFYIKHDLPAALSLSEKYKIKNSKFKKSIKNYLDADRFFENKNKF